MDVFSTATLNNVNYAIVGKAGLFEPVLNTKYGFELYWRGRPGARWTHILRTYKFDSLIVTLEDTTFGKCFYTETYARTLDLADFGGYSFKLRWIDKKRTYELVMDYADKMISLNSFKNVTL